jgi:L-lactate dehydrogenase complex protein LldF
VLIHLRGEAVDDKKTLDPERLAMKAMAMAFSTRTRYEAAQRLGRVGQKAPGIERLPGPLRAWTATRDLPPVAKQTFREWWRERT